MSLVTAISKSFKSFLVYVFIRFSELFSIVISLNNCVILYLILVLFVHSSEEFLV